MRKLGKVKGLEFLISEEDVRLMKLALKYRLSLEVIADILEERVEKVIRRMKEIARRGIQSQAYWQGVLKKVYGKQARLTEKADLAFVIEGLEKLGYGKHPFTQKLREDLAKLE